MLYESTRGQISPVSSAEAIKMGIAPDGGLFVPCNKIKLSTDQLTHMLDMNYQEQAFSILKLFLTDFSHQELTNCIYRAYNHEKFDTPEIAPVHQLNHTLFLLELWHGPTCAFKDMALQLLPHLLTTSVQKTDEESEIIILVATSGDTGKAALEGFKDVPGTKIIVFYPEQGVSEIQKRQMITQEGNNVEVIAVTGNFDDAQNGVKEIFGDNNFRYELAEKKRKLSSANSINWGRLVPQIVYYVSAYLSLLKQKAISPGESINIVVPTGNFGNILGAFYARQMGLPINRLICAVNSNYVLTDFIRTGIYNRNRPFKKTISPSMDILISSNLERLLYELTDHDSTKIQTWMAQLQKEGQYKIDNELHKSIQQIFWSDFATDEETLNTIKDTYQQHGYVLDTHTAVGKNVYHKYVKSTDDQSKTIIASTASPFKFANSVAKAIFGSKITNKHDEFTLLELLSNNCKLNIPKALQDLNKKSMLHLTKTDRDKMKATVRKILELN